MKRAHESILIPLFASLLASCSAPSAAPPTSEYAVRLSAAGVLTAFHAGMQLQTRFETAHVALLAAGSAGEATQPVDLAALAWGCESAMQELPGVKPATSAALPGGVAYQHADFEEWYVLGPAGLEQGFTIHRLPECAERGEPLRIELAFRDTPLLRRGADGEALLSAPGSQVIHYGQAFAKDAAGNARDVRISTDRTLALEIDARAASLPLRVDPLAWVQQGKLTPSDGAVGDFFGKSTAISGNTALVGAPAAGALGAAYVFVRSGTSWTLQQKLVASDGAPGDSFGTAVALSGDTALIGASSDDDTAVDAGSAYVFVRSGGSFAQRKKLVASDAAASDHFGASVALSGNFVLIGAPFKDSAGASNAGAAYVFQGSAATWTQQTELTPTNAAEDHNGAGVAISGNALAVSTDRPNGYAVSFYNLSGSAWLAGLGGVNSTSASFAHFGSALAMSANYTVIGGYAVDAGSATTPGSVLVVRNSTHGTQYLLKAGDPAANDQFGSSVAISENDTILIGSAKDDDKGTDSGSAYVFTLTTTWLQQQKLLASDGLAGDGFGSAVALSGSSALIGAPSFGDKTGSAYVLGFGSSNGTACAQNSECGSGFCVEKVCCNGACNGTCQSCLQKNKVGNTADGLCGNVRSNTDPLDACAASPPDTCGKTGVCDGKGACATYSQGTSCTYSACASPTSATLNSACNVSGECKPLATVACQLGYQCVAGVCKSGCQSNTDCDASLGFVCTQEGVCKQPKGGACNGDASCSTGACQWGSCCLPNADGVCIKPLGTECATGGECASGMCSSGVCCSTSCDGTCLSCALPASKGKCAPSEPGTSCALGNASTGQCDGQGQCTESMGGGGTSGQTGSGGDGQGGEFAGSSGIGQGASSGVGQGASSGVGQGASAGFGVAGDAGSGQGGRAGSGPGGTGAGATANAGSGPRAGAGGHTGGSVECTNDSQCTNGLACDPRSNTCQDQLVTACGCRVPTSRSTSNAQLTFLACTLSVMLARRKRRS